MDMLSLLDRDALSKIEQALKSDTDIMDSRRYELSISSFVREVYRTFIDCDGSRSIDILAEDERDLVENICKLFDLLDVDATGVVNWVDFTDFCACAPGRAYRNTEDKSHALVDERGREYTVAGFVQKPGFTARASHCHEVRSSDDGTNWTHPCLTSTPQI